MELLAPAGDPQALYAAVAAGADAVYFGLGDLNARAKAQGFDCQNVKTFVDYCHLHGVKAYIALNTEIKNSERQKLREIACAAAQAGADAFIVADIGVTALIGDLGVPLHASTQMGICNLEGAKYLERYGYTRVVVARETLLCDVAEIKRHTKLEVEYFVHGALCVAYSGACLASAMRSGDSGNRGRCMQPCRMKYASSFGAEGYLLSPADQCLVGRLAELREAGADSLKIEGRLKQPQYVWHTVSQYRAVLDGRESPAAARAELLRAFNRGNFSEGYNFADTRKLMYPKVQNNIGVRIGEVVSASRGRAVVDLSESINIGDGLKVLTRDGREKGGFGASAAVGKGKGVKMSVPPELGVARGDVLAKTFDSAFAAQAICAPMPVEIELGATAVVGEPFCVTARRGDIAVTAKGAQTLAAEKRPLDEGSLAAALDRLGGSGFCAKSIKTHCGEGAFVPPAEINKTRRAACEQLKAAILDAYDNGRRRVFAKPPYDVPKIEIGEMYEVEDMSQADVDAHTLCVAPRDYTADTARKLADECRRRGKKIFCRLPMVVRGEDMRVLKRFLDECDDVLDGYLCDNWYALELARERGKLSIAGHRLNLCSDEAIASSGANAAIASAELSIAEYRALGADALCYAVGDLPVMTLTHCPVKLNTGCDCAHCAYDGEFWYRDKAATYRVVRKKLAHCTFDVYNPSTVCAPSAYRPYIKPFVSLVGMNGLTISQYLADPDLTGIKKTAGLLSRGVK